MRTTCARVVHEYVSGIADKRARGAHLDAVLRTEEPVPDAAVRETDVRAARKHVFGVDLPRAAVLGERGEGRVDGDGFGDVWERGEEVFGKLRG